MSALLLHLVECVAALVALLCVVVVGFAYVTVKLAPESEWMLTGKLTGVVSRGARGGTGAE